ncbi:LysR substrate-binding domain-containing protein [Rhizobium sp. SSA_523]|uniref:LysR substrate-binding domain-containing protein n=1 Tax=Rhizobium sp. SSA_523 TaxID=2952477 RepID=UPI002090C592|nr:LysR substrate-binding domain-containing protein [Rhizobium sp. SSA_523]MCO5734182.1 LysR substrate-binding domain-containing protein [Rhizobium sp. SSA_523]WKC21537.1 LysR substrate-binding domain-containing protein [Rhizobium sp. SSA_523]
MNIRQLEAFHATMETGSVTLAGERLGVSQPAVSKLLRSFSDACGFTLFTRSGGRLVPTLEARMLAAEVDRMFAGTKRIARLAEAVRNREWGEVTLAAPAALATRYLTQALSPFLAEQPDIHLTLLSRNSPRIGELVASGQVDIGLSVLPFDQPSIRSEIIMRFSMVCVLPAAHPLARKQVIEIDDLRNELFVSLPRDDCSLMTIDRAFQMRGVQKRNRIEVPLSETACSLVANGVGISIVPPFVGIDYANDRLVRRTLLPETFMDVWLLTPSGRAPSLAAQMLADFIRTAVSPFDQRAKAASA